MWAKIYLWLDGWLASKARQTKEKLTAQAQQTDLQPTKPLANKEASADVLGSGEDGWNGDGSAATIIK
jgi:hypothetical protein